MTGEHGTTASGWDSIGYSSFGQFLRVLGASEHDHRLIEHPGLVATVSPQTPEHSLFNSVLYEHPAALEDHYAELEQAYDDAGIRAWVVWAPDVDKVSLRLLAEHGHQRAGARMMTLDLHDVPDAGDDSEVSRAFDWETLCAINDAAYGYPGPTFLRGMGRRSGEQLRRYGLNWRGFPASATATLDHERDCGVYLVATLPEARRQGLAARVLVTALLEARGRGCATSTLQASPAGAGLYTRLGYRDLGAVHFCERRRLD
jgi:GNAT superfamily N-acetyltransferase